MTTPAILAGWLYVPWAAIGTPRDRGNLKLSLIHTPPRQDTGDKRSVAMFDDMSLPGYMGVPKAWGLEHFAHLPVVDHTVLGQPMQGVTRLPSPNHPKVLDPAAQAKFMVDLEAGLRTHRTLCASAPTGSGKTVVALRTAARLGRTTLILVHLERLAVQWVREITSKLGVDPSRIGRVQANKCQYEGKDFVVGILHSVAHHQYPAAFYTAFGLVIYDEVHKAGTEFFAPAVSLFPSRYSLGLSATLKRRDGGERVFYSHLGPVRVTSTAEALPIRVHVKDYDAGNRPMWGKEHGARMQCISQDDRRNALIAKFIVRFWQLGRNALIVSDRIEHLQDLQAMALRAGVPAAAMGQFTGEVHGEATNTQGKRVRVKTKRTSTELDDVQAKAQLIFATYGMMTEGIDIPRLDAGIDALPRWEATQLIGRIRRPLPGKKLPLWVTIRDTRCQRSQGYFKLRCKDYRATNAEVISDGA